MNTIESVYVPEIAPALKHPTILEKFDNLKNGESFLIVNDHDPIPLYYELKAEKGEVFEWTKIEDGPEVWKVEIKRTAGAKPSSGMTAIQESALTENVSELNVTLIEPKLKHPTIFKYFDELQPGEAFRILNDHDPKPLYYQMLGERGNVFTWEYLEKGPWWRVQIRKNDGNTETLGEIAAKDLRKAEVFKKCGLDFCCGGKKTVQQACAEKGIDSTKVEEELRQAQTTTSSRPLPYDEWNLDFLADYIVNTHHSYVRKTLPDIRAYALKVAGVHGSRHPELHNIRTLAEEIANELTEHMLKEEQILFPFIKKLVTAKNEEAELGPKGIGTVRNAGNRVQHVHGCEGGCRAQIRQLSRNDGLPDDAFASYKLLCKMPEEGEADRFTHIRLQDTIPSPAALKP